MSAALAFRLYVEFNNPIRRGTLDIWFVKVGDKQKAQLVWTGSLTPAGPLLALDAKKNVYLVALDQTKDSQRLWLHRDGGRTPKQLDVHGAVLFEQYEDGLLTRRWPLVREFGYGANDPGPYFSQLVFDDNSFLLQLALPMPISQTSNSEYPCPKVFVIRAEYNSSLDPAKSLIKAKKIWIGAKRKTDPTLMNIKETTQVLGDFGFTIKAKDDKAYSDGNPTFDKNFWPRDISPSVFEFLNLLGFSVKNGSVKTPNNDSRTEDDAALSFSGISSLRVRASLQSNVVENEELHLKIHNKKLGLQLDKSTLIRTSNHIIYCDLSVEWSIPTDILSVWQEARITAILSIELSANMSANVKLKTLGKFDANPVTQQYQDSLKTVLGAQPQSFLPSFKDGIIFSYLKCELQASAKLGSRPDFKPAMRANLGFVSRAEISFPSIDTTIDSFWDLSLEGDSNLEKRGFFQMSTFKISSKKTSFDGRLGALRFRFLKKESADTAILGDGSIDKLNRLNLNLQITQASPVTIDRAWGDREVRSSPLLISESTSAGEAKFGLEVRETFSQRDDWHLTATLSDNTTSIEKGEDVYTVISDQPFSLFRFARTNLINTGSPEDAVIASYDSDARTWLFKKVSPSYHYVFPPQSVGESTDKPRRLEIHDPAKLPDQDNGEYLHPYLTSDPEGTTFLVEYRTTPSAEIWIKPSDLERNYFLPEWSAHDIFRQRNDFGLGAALVGLRAEFLYGLTVGVDVSREQGPSRGARIAEIEALMGKVPQAAHQKDLTTPGEKRWAQLRPALLRRHERLELWAADGDKPFAPAHFADGVNFALRKSALHRTPVPIPINAKAFVDPPIRHDEQGLPGGALWPLEFWNAFEALLEDPSSIGGTLEGVALSPTGGDADQKALFLNGIMSVISETRGGFVQRQQVEILGRIGAHWHRAKHVVVYERTVNPSAQFAPDFADDGSHLTRSRRPILRKVSEYVELLEASRSYPDSDAGPQSCGFLKTIRYNSRRIHVDSAWGSEVADVGYQIPLWNLHSARQRPQVYPMPDVVFELLSEGETDNAVCAKSCLDPDNIYFFADVKSREPDTNKWQARTGIDANETLPASYIAKELTPTVEDGRIRPAVSKVLPGYRRFTWRLSSGGPKVRVNAGFGERPIYADVESMTFMRAAPSVSGERKSQQEKLIGLINSPQLAPIQNLPIWSDGLRGNDPISVLAKLNEEFLKHVASEDVAHATDAFAKLQDGMNQLATFGGDWRGIGDKISQASARLKGVSVLINSIEPNLKSCEELSKSAADSIRRKRQLIQASLSDWQKQTLAQMDDLLSPPVIVPKTWRDKVKIKISEQITRQLTPVFDWAYTPVDGIRTDIEKARSIVSATELDAESSFLRLIARLDEIKASYRDDKPWSDFRVEAFHLKLQQEWRSLNAQILAVAAEAKQRIASELSQRSSKLSALVNKVLQSAASELARGVEAGSAMDAQLPHYFAMLRAPLEQLSGEKGKLKAVTDQLEKIKDTHDEIYKNASSYLLNAKTMIEKARLDLIALEGKTEANLASMLLSANEWKGAIEAQKLEFEKAIKDFIGELKKIPKDQITAVETELLSLAADAEILVKRITQWSERQLRGFGDLVDPLIDDLILRLLRGIQSTKVFKQKVFDTIESWLTVAQTHLNTFDSVLSPKILVTAIIDKAAMPLVDGILDRIRDEWITDHDTKRIKEQLAVDLATFAEAVAGSDGALSKIEGKLFDGIDGVEKACEFLSNSYMQVKNRVELELDAVELQIRQRIATVLGDYTAIKSLLDDVTKYPQIFKSATEAAEKVGEAVNQVSEVAENLKGLAHQVMDAASQIGQGGLAAAPSNILKTYSAAVAAIDMGGAQVESLRASWEDAIKTTQANLGFARLGDALKSIGLDFPVNGLADSFKIDEETLKKYDVSRMFKNFGGIKLDGMFKGVKVPQNIKDAVKVSHEFDKKQARAWVQVDVNVKAPGRNQLFAIGPFALYFKDASLIGTVRLEASKDTAEVQETGSSALIASIEAVVAGQVMVTLEQATLRYSKETGLDFDFDPANIKLNQNFKFIQDTLGSIFPDEIGGLSIIKESGIPVGVEHLFSLPNMSLSFGTSGVSNIQIINKFRLLAYPDFIISNRFNLSTVEMPFIFSIFILGGTGYIQIDAEYRPFDNRLMVVVEAAAGASAGLGFAFGPVQGSVFITLSVAISYRKLIGSGGGGLSVSLVLVIAGNVSLWGMVNIYLGLILRMTYRDSGQIDASGDLIVEVRISRFFKLKYRTTVNYKLRGGQSQVTRSSSVDVETEGKLDAIRKKAELLKGARS